MKDKDFELFAERSLIVPDNYFDRYACLYQTCGTAEKAWQAVEAEFHAQTGGNRFLTLSSFHAAQSRHRSGERVRSIVVKIES